MHHFKDNLQHLRELKDNAMGQCVSIAHNVSQPAQSGGFRNPVIDKDFPGRLQSRNLASGCGVPVRLYSLLSADPFCCRFGRYFFAFATNANGSNVQCAVSDDLVQWRAMGGKLEVWEVIVCVALFWFECWGCSFWSYWFSETLTKLFACSPIALRSEGA